MPSFAHARNSCAYLEYKSHPTMIDDDQKLLSFVKEVNSLPQASGRYMGGGGFQDS